MNHLELTLTVFFFILFIFILFPSAYWLLSPQSLRTIERKPLIQDWRFLIPAILYALILGFRWNYSYDWDQYYNTFNFIQHGVLYRDTTEKGYLLINYLLGHLGFNHYSIFILEGFTYIFAIYTLAKDNRKVLLFSLPFIYIAARNDSLNISRQFFAQSVLWIAFYYLVKCKKKIYFVLSLLAVSIHTTALIWTIAFYFVRYLRFPSVKISISIYLIMWAISNIAQIYLFEASELFSALDILGKHSYGVSHMMLDRFQGRDLSLYRMVLIGTIHVGYIISADFVLKRIKIKSEFESILMTIGFVGVCMEVLGGTHEILHRFFWYFSFLYYVAWGYVIFYLIKSKSPIPTSIVLLNVLGVLQLFWSMYPTIVSEVTGEGRQILEYKINLLNWI